MTGENLCVYCGKRVRHPRKKYCDDECMNRYKLEGPARERWVYKRNPSPACSELEELLDSGVWLMFPASQDDDQCIGDFMRVWKKPPKHVIWIPKFPMWKFAGPVWSEDVLARRWQGKR